jgi:hypothetical protein
MAILGLAHSLLGANDVYHLALVKDDDVLVGRRVAQAHPFLAAHRLDFADGVFGKLGPMTAVTFVGGGVDFFGHRLIKLWGLHFGHALFAAYI